MNSSWAAYYMPHIVFFSAWFAVGVSVLYYHYRKHSHPRFRPSVGEMSMLSVLMVAVGLGASIFLGNIFRGDRDFAKDLSGKPDNGAGWSKVPRPATSNGDADDKKDDSRSSH